MFSAYLASCASRSFAPYTCSYVVTVQTEGRGASGFFTHTQQPQVSQPPATPRRPLATLRPGQCVRVPCRRVVRVARGQFGFARWRPTQTNFRGRPTPHHTKHQQHCWQQGLAGSGGSAPPAQARRPREAALGWSRCVRACGTWVGHVWRHHFDRRTHTLVVCRQGGAVRTAHCSTTHLRSTRRAQRHGLHLQQQHGRGGGGRHSWQRPAARDAGRG